MTTLVAAFTVVLLAGAAQGVTGFGFALVAVPLLQLLLPPREAVVASTLAALVLTIGTAVHERRHARWRGVWPMVAAVVAGMPVALLLLRALDDRALMALTAVVVLTATVLVWRPPSLPSGPATVTVAGLVAGVLSTSTSTNGPPLVAALQAAGYPPREFRATLAVVFSLTGAVALAGFAWAGALTGDAARTGAVGVPAAALGWLLGNRLFARVDAALFRRVVLIGLVASSVVALGRAVLV